MNRTPDVELVLRDYFVDDGLTAPDYVLDVVEARISRHPPRRTWRPPWSNPMPTPSTPAAARAGLVLVALVAWQLLPRPQDNVGGRASSTPTLQPSASSVVPASPSAAPSGGAACPEWKTDGCGDGAGILTAGSHSTRGFMPAFTFSVPEGWVNSSDSRDYFQLFPDTPANQAEFARSDGFADSILMGPNQSPYFVCDSFEDSRGTTAAEIVAAMGANEALAMTAVGDVELGGLTGKQFDVRLNPDWTEPCPGDPPGFDLGDMRSRGILLDAPGRGVLVIIVGSLHSADFEAFLAEAMPIVESFEFDLEQ